MGRFVLLEDTSAEVTTWRILVLVEDPWAGKKHQTVFGVFEDTCAELGTIKCLGLGEDP